MQLNLIVDRVVKGKVYPSLAKFQAEPFTQTWREFHHHWPNTIPLRLQEYLESAGIGLNLTTNADSVLSNTYYPIGLAWFNFDIDYFELIPPHILDLVKSQTIQILFYYHEGDNPLRIKQRLDWLAVRHFLPLNAYVFVSSNSAADQLPQFVSFQDSELWYWHRNKTTNPLDIHRRPRSREFTALNRLHKWWRAVAMTDLHRSGILKNSYWSYCERETGHDTIDECPIEIDSVPNLRNHVQGFLKHAPYYADDLSQEQRNDHSKIVNRFFEDSYCNIVIETMFDYDQSGGVLLSEKTFKAIKHGQLFFVAGAAGSLQLLRDLGYRTFDSVLDNSYDSIKHNTQRWIALRNAIKSAQQQGIGQLFEQAREDIEHNQQIFLQSKRERLSMLLQKIHDKSR